MIPLAAPLHLIFEGLPEELVGHSLSHYVEVTPPVQVVEHPAIDKNGLRDSSDLRVHRLQDHLYYLTSVNGAFGEDVKNVDGDEFLNLNTLSLEGVGRYILILEKILKERHAELDGVKEMHYVLNLLQTVSDYFKSIFQLFSGPTSVAARPRHALRCESDSCEVEKYEARHPLIDLNSLLEFHQHLLRGSGDPMLGHGSTLMLKLIHSNVPPVDKNKS